MSDAATEETERLVVLSLEREVAASAAQASLLRVLLTNWLTGAGLPDLLAEDVRLAAYEVMANAVDHAYPGRDDGTMTLAARLGHGSLTVEVTDFGHWREGPPLSFGGRGLPLIRRLAPQATVTTAAAGTTVLMVWPLSTRAAASWHRDRADPA
ncbi:ATP-binding protein [Amycolatopsis sp. 195334CR]|uniref:ATP-binding protein n=1 Tax=Amycolatopsis sp. 195334CR TaxID=2814588 RepID=UPI001A8D1CBB|nr:ATP-binding protein [Amycolatopsis sp. 195334CR]MBN6038483.1 ATP-binding protein [Amycolatopsis sp. 195334CR]